MGWRLLGVCVGGTLWGRVWLVLELDPSLLPGPERSQLVAGEATVTDLDGLEPDTEYIVHVRAHVSGVEGAPASVVVRTGEWTLASCEPYFPGWPLPTLLCISDCSACPVHCCPVNAMPAELPLWVEFLPTVHSWLPHTVQSETLTSLLPRHPHKLHLPFRPCLNYAHTCPPLLCARDPGLLTPHFHSVLSS